MNRNWFRNEAKFMMFPNVLILIAGFIALVVPIYLNSFEPVIHAGEKVQPDFHIGFYFGSIDQMEINILQTYGDLEFMLNKNFQHPYKSSHVKRKITELNILLLGIYQYKDYIPINLNWPTDIHEIIIEGNDTRKKIYRNIKEQRIVNNWIDEDVEDENKINEVLDLYIEYGNPFKLK